MLDIRAFSIISTFLPIADEKLGIDGFPLSRYNNYILQTKTL